MEVGVHCAVDSGQRNRPPLGIWGTPVRVTTTVQFYHWSCPQGSIEKERERGRKDSFHTFWHTQGYFPVLLEIDSFLLSAHTVLFYLCESQIMKKNINFNYVLLFKFWFWSSICLLLFWFQSPKMFAFLCRLFSINQWEMCANLCHF